MLIANVLIISLFLFTWTTRVSPHPGIGPNDCIYKEPQEYCAAAMGFAKCSDLGLVSFKRQHTRRKDGNNPKHTDDLGNVGIDVL